MLKILFKIKTETYLNSKKDNTSKTDKFGTMNKNPKTKVNNSGTITKTKTKPPPSIKPNNNKNNNNK